MRESRFMTWTIATRNEDGSVASHHEFDKPPLNDERFLTQLLVASAPESVNDTGRVFASRFHIPELMS
jgi:hypothetical protein